MTSMNTNNPTALEIACYSDNIPEINRLIGNTYTQDVLKKSILYCIDRMNFVSAIQIAQKINDLGIGDTDYDIFCLLFSKINSSGALTLTGDAKTLFNTLMSRFGGDVSTLFIWAVANRSIHICEYIRRHSHISGVTYTDEHYKINPLVYAVTQFNKSDLVRIFADDVFEQIHISLLITAINESSKYHTDTYLYLLRIFTVRNPIDTAMHHKIVYNIIFSEKFVEALADKTIRDYLGKYANYMVSVIYTSYALNNSPSATSMYISKLAALEAHSLCDLTINHVDTGYPLLYYIIISQAKCIAEIKNDVQFTPISNFPNIRKIDDLKIPSPFPDEPGEQQHKTSDTASTASVADITLMNTDTTDDEPVEFKAMSGGANTDFGKAMRNEMLDFHTIRNKFISQMMPDGRFLFIHYLDNIYNKLVVGTINPLEDLAFMNRCTNIAQPSLQSGEPFIKPFITYILDNMIYHTNYDPIVSMLRLLAIYGYDVQQLFVSHKYTGFILSDKYVLDSMITMGVVLDKDVIHNYLKTNTVKNEVVNGLLDMGFIPTEVMIDEAIVGDPNTLYNRFLQHMASEKKKLQNYNLDLRVRGLYKAKNEWRGNIYTDSYDAKDVHVISAHGSILPDTYFCLPPNIGIMAMAERGKEVWNSPDHMSNMLTKQNRGKFFNAKIKTPVQGYTYYPPGSIIQEQNLTFNSDNVTWYQEYKEDNTYRPNLPLFPENDAFFTLGVITQDCKHTYDLDRDFFIVDKKININGRNIIPIVDGKVFESFINRTINPMRKSSYLLQSNDENIFANHELWTSGMPRYLLLSQVIRRLDALGKHGNFMLYSCRSGVIAGDDLHLKACRRFAQNFKKQGDDLPKRVALARQISVSPATSNFYDKVKTFAVYFANECSGCSPQYDQGILYLGNLQINVPYDILNLYGSDKVFSNERYRIRLQGKRRVINKKWIAEFEKNILHSIQNFLHNMEIQIYNQYHIHTVEYCRLYSLINHVLPYISSTSLLCYQKKVYGQICAQV